MEVIVDTTKGVYKERIVRCAECKHNHDGTCEYAEWECKPDDFCSYGEPSNSENPNNSTKATISKMEQVEDEPQTERSE